MTLTDRINIIKSYIIVKAYLNNLIYKALPPGTIRQRKSGKWKKQQDGTWTKIKTENKKVIDEKNKSDKQKSQKDLKNIKKIDYLNDNDKKQIQNEITSKLDIPSENIYIHSTINDGLSDLIFNKQSGEGDKNYLSASSLGGSKKFLEKGGAGTIFTILDTPKNEVDFHERGDVGWKGGSPRATTYDEAGLKDWDVKGLLIPPYYNNNKNVIANAILANNTIEQMNGDILPIIGADQKLIDSVENEIQNEYNKYETEIGGRVGKEEYEEFLQKMLKRYAY